MNPGYWTLSVQVGITPSDDDTIDVLTSGAMPFARGLNVATAGAYKITDLADHDTTVTLAAGYNPCPCTKVWNAGAAATTGVVAVY